MIHVLPGVLWTLALHSTVFLGLAWIVARRFDDDPAARERLWLGAVMASLVGPALHGGLAAALDLAGAGRNTLALKGDVGPLGTLVLEASAPLGPGQWPAWVMILALGWAVAAGTVLASNAMRRRMALKGLARVQGPPGPARELDAVARTMGMRRPVRLTASARLATPVALGSSEVCVPADFARSVPVDERTALFGHEVAHLRRRDGARLAALDAACAVLFFQPLIWRAREEVRGAAEMACDAAGTRAAGSPVAMVRALERLGRRYQGHPGAHAAALASPSLLVRRVHRIAAGTGEPRGRPGLATALAVAAVALLLLAPGTGGAIRIGMGSDHAPWLGPAPPARGVVDDVSRWKTALRLPSGETVRIEAVNAGFDGGQVQVAPGGQLSVTQAMREGERRVTWTDSGAPRAVGPFAAGQEPERWAVEMLRRATR